MQIGETPGHVEGMGEAKATPARSPDLSEGPQGLQRPKSLESLEKAFVALQKAPSIANFNIFLTEQEKAVNNPANTTDSLKMITDLTAKARVILKETTRSSSPSPTTATAVLQHAASISSTKDLKIPQQVGSDEEDLSAKPGFALSGDVPKEDERRTVTFSKPEAILEPVKKFNLCKFVSSCFRGIGKKLGFVKTEAEVRTAKTTALTRILCQPQEIPSAVKELVKTANHNITVAKGIKRDEKGNAQRTGNWLETQQGKPEAEVRKEFAAKIKAGKLEAPKPFSMQTIQEVHSALPGRSKSAAVKDQITCQLGIPADLLQQDLTPPAMVCVASGMNFMELADSSVDEKDEQRATIAACSSDRTQGGQTVAGAATSGELRYAARDAGVLQHALIHCGVKPELLDKCFQNGYLLLRNLNQTELAELRDHIKANIHKLEILPQEVMNEEFMTQFTQIFTAAPDLTGVKPENRAVADEISEIMVVAQYKAMAQMAVIRGRSSEKPVPLHMTLVGQGAFSNSPIVMGKALAEMAKIVRGENVQVIYQLYHVADALKLINGASLAQSRTTLPPGLLQQAVKKSFEDIQNGLMEDNDLANSLNRQFPTLTQEVKEQLLSELKKPEYQGIIDQSQSLHDFIEGPKTT